jgi:hypothetical protein
MRDAPKARDVARMAFMSCHVTLSDRRWRIHHKLLILSAFISFYHKNYSRGGYSKANKTVAIFAQKHSRTGGVMDCGGKRSATPLSCA